MYPTGTLGTLEKPRGGPQDWLVEGSGTQGKWMLSPPKHIFPWGSQGFLCIGSEEDWVSPGAGVCVCVGGGVTRELTLPREQQNVPDQGLLP